jgi:hypothetical protein
MAYRVETVIMKNQSSWLLGSPRRTFATTASTPNKSPGFSGLLICSHSPGDQSMAQLARPRAGLVIRIETSFFAAHCLRPSRASIVGACDKYCVRDATFTAGNKNKVLDSSIGDFPPRARKKRLIFLHFPRIEKKSPMATADN